MTTVLDDEEQMSQFEASIRKPQVGLIVKVAITTVSCHRLTEE
jgi:hypothetical protein